MLVVFSRRAISQAAAIHRYISADNPAAADRFMKRLGEVAERLARFPESSPEAIGAFRRALVVGYPYLVIYRVAPHRLSVVSVVHAARHPSRRYDP